MARKITDSCVMCGSCAGECPVGAISQGEAQYEIDEAACIDCGAFLLIPAGVTKDGYVKLLQEGDYTKENKSNKLLKVITPVYWLVATAIYLAWSLPTNAWDISWVVWPIAGVLFGGLAIVLKTVGEQKK